MLKTRVAQNQKYEGNNNFSKIEALSAQNFLQLKLLNYALPLNLVPDSSYILYRNNSLNCPNV